MCSLPPYILPLEDTQNQHQKVLQLIKTLQNKITDMNQSQLIDYLLLNLNSQEQVNNVLSLLVEQGKLELPKNMDDKIIKCTL